MDFTPVILPFVNEALKVLGALGGSAGLGVSFGLGDQA